MNQLPTFADIEKAHDRIRPFIHCTPVLTSQSINQIVGTELFFKCENLQKVGAFKFRGAFNTVASLKKEELDNIVIDITILTVPRKVGNYKEIQIGRDGVILNKIDASGQVKATAVFLPQVPGQFGWNLATTLEHLSQKAGLGKNDWQHDCEFEVFEGFEIREK